jgi:hypothetical protein
MVKDATASYSNEEMHAALDVNIPNYASAIVTTHEVGDSMSSLQGFVEHGRNIVPTVRRHDPSI